MDVAEGEVPTAAKLRKLRVIDLRKRLQGLELPQSGINVGWFRTFPSTRHVFSVASLGFCHAL